MSIRILALSVLLGALASGAQLGAAEELVPVAAFDFELIDTSLEGELRGESVDEQRRLAAIGERLRRMLEESGRYQVVDLEPFVERIEAAGYIRSCNGCELEIARLAGADLAITGTVQKVSNLILNINVYVGDVAKEGRVRAYSVDIRGNTDQSWSRGISYLVRNQLLQGRHKLGD